VTLIANVREGDIVLSTGEHLEIQDFEVKCAEAQAGKLLEEAPWVFKMREG